MRERNVTLGFVRRELEHLKGRVEAVETVQGQMPWSGQERRKDASFSDSQVEWLKKFHDERNEIRLGRIFLRLIVWSFGAAATGTASILFAYFKIRGN